MVLERLPGRDLGEVIGGLSAAQRDGVVERVAAAQALVAALAAAGRYGYSPSAEAAPHRRWTGVVRAHLERSRERIAAAGLFGPDAANAVEARVDAAAAALEVQPSTPFLHDTTVKNVIVADNGRFSGIVDVDDLCFGDPRYVVALTEAALLVHGEPLDYVAAWRARSGFADDGLYRLYVALFLLDLMSEHGHAFNGNVAPSEAAGRERLARLLADALQRQED